MIQPLFNGMLAILLAKFMLNDLPHAAGLAPDSSEQFSYIYLTNRGSKLARNVRSLVKESFKKEFGVIPNANEVDWVLNLTHEECAGKYELGYLRSAKELGLERLIKLGVIGAR